MGGYAIFGYFVGLITIKYLVVVVCNAMTNSDSQQTSHQERLRRFTAVSSSKIILKI